MTGTGGLARGIRAALLAAAFVVAAGCGSDRPQFKATDITGTSYGREFALTDHDGKARTLADFRGKAVVLFFGYTHCPDICPTTLFEMAQVEPLLGPAVKDLQTVFISVDPGRDTVAQMKAYVANDAFPKRLIGLTGTPEQVDAAAKAYRIYYQKVGDGDDYQVNHAAYSYLINPRGKFACVLAYDLTPEQTAAKIQAAMKQGDRATSC